MTALAMDRAPKPELALDRDSLRTYDDKAGHLHVAISPFSKATVRPYWGKEIPGADKLGLDLDRKYYLYLDPGELAKGAGTFSGKPLLIEHREQTADNHDPMKVVGAVGDAEWAEPYAAAPLAVWDGDAIEEIESGRMQELSAGFYYTPDMTPGTVDGQRYDGVMRDIQGNHVALVEAGRAGPDVMVLDSKLKELPRMKRLTPAAAAARSILTDYLAPRLASDAALDIRSLVAPISAKTWAADRARIASAVKGAKLAADADMTDLETALDEVEEEVKVEAEDEKAAEDTKHAKGEDEDEDEDEEVEVKASAARDAAISKAARDAAAATRAEMRAIRDAERAVAPFVGEIAVAMDSAGDVYRFAFDHLGMDVKGVHESAYGALLAAHAKAHRMRSTTIAADAAPKDFDSRWGRPAGAPKLLAG